MSEYFTTAYFVYSQTSENLVEEVIQNACDCQITAIAIDYLLRQPTDFYHSLGHVVVAGEMAEIKTILKLAMQYGFSVGLIASNKQKDLINSFSLPKNLKAAIILALSNNPQWVDLVLCNGHVLLYKATVGWIPLLDHPLETRRSEVFYHALKKLRAIKLLNFKFKPFNYKAINTAASGCMILKHNNRSFASKLLAYENCSQDGALSLLIVSPYSIIAYLKFLLTAIIPSYQHKTLPAIFGYVKSQQLDLELDAELKVSIDGEELTRTPLHCTVANKAIRINAGSWLEQENNTGDKQKEIIDIANLPDEKERIKVTEKNIPFFSYASEERFRHLFTALREDASINGIYVIMMVLSTMLATIGLYLDSAAVIIGAMLLAPLMAPIVSAAMGLLRQDSDMLNQSTVKIFIGVLIALLASTLMSIVFSYKPLTDEMQNRLNPTILDLAVAIVSGIAAAYSKSFKEILQSLAGVAIAVALVPPLSVAGIGIGRGDFHFFSQAFLLFSTNLVGIILAALFTFRVLGYSPVVKNRRGFSYVLLSFLLITAPLYLSYEQIVRNVRIEKLLEKERYLVNGKYIIIQDVKLGRSMGKEIVMADILVRESLDREDLHLLKKKIEHYYGKEMVIRTRVAYIL